MIAMQAVLAGKGHHALEVRDLQQRIGHRLDIDGAGLRAQLRLPGFGPLCVDEIGGQPQAREFAGNQIVRAAVQAALREQVVSGSQQRQQRPGDRRHAAGRDQRGLGTLERRHLRVQRQLARGVVVAQVTHVIVAAFAAVGVGCRLEDRHLHGTGDPRQRFTRVHELCFQALVIGHGGSPRAIVTQIRYRVRMPFCRDARDHVERHCAGAPPVRTRLS